MTDRARGDVLGVVGGSGLYEIEGLIDAESLRVDTPFGPPSDAIVRGHLGSTTLLFLPRHGKGHGIAPHEINFRANVCAMKKLGATHLLSVSAVGSLKEHIAPGDFVVVDQFVDLTRKRASTFFEGGVVAHVGLAEPTCPALSASVAAAAERGGTRVHRGGTYVCIEGPQFSTRAESHLYRTWGASVIGMTAMPEAKLAREAELPYALLALATDYDCWHETAETVRAEDVVAVMRRNVAAARVAVAEVSRTLPDPSGSAAASALAGSLMTSFANIPPAAMDRLGWLIAKYAKGAAGGGKGGGSP